MSESRHDHSRPIKRSRFDMEPPKMPRTYRSVKAILKTSLLNPLNNNPLSQRYFELLKVRSKLPVFEYLDAIESAVDRNQIVIIEGETGSGKTTQIPQALLLYLLEHGYRTPRIACTQPRRVAATNVAKRVSEELDVQIGAEVGYTIRFEDMTSEKTLLKYLTDGMLLREALYDPQLSRYDIIILDEAHERTINTDILMAFIKEICQKRHNLKFILMSATLDVAKFQNYFKNAPIVSIPGRLFPVEIFFSQKPEKDYVEATIRTITKIHQTEDSGDILAFLTGEQEIMNVCERLRIESLHWLGEQRKVLIYPLFSSLPSAQQQLVFTPTPSGYRKIVISTNIAETSLTIDGIVYVIDSGFAKQKVYNPKFRAEYLLVSSISKVNAQQRAGRAGRTRPGKCFRLYTEQSFQEKLIVLDQPFPEIIRSDITSTVLSLKALGIDNLSKFDFIDPPSTNVLIRALEQLSYLGALDYESNLTPIGRLLASIPINPQQAKCLLLAPQFNCMNEMLTITSMLNVPQPFLRPVDKQHEADECKRQFGCYEGDHIVLLNLYNEYIKINESDRSQWCSKNFINYRSMLSAVNIRHQLMDLMISLNIPMKSSPVKDEALHNNNIRRCLCKGFFMQVAHREKGGYLTVKDHQSVSFHPSTTMPYEADWVIYNEFVFTTSHYIRTISQIDPKWLIEDAPFYYDITNYPNSEAKSELIKLYEEKFRYE